MFTIEKASAEAIRRAFDDRGELAAVAEFRRRFPGVTDDATARQHVRIIAGWKPLPARAGSPAPR